MKYVALLAVLLISHVSPALSMEKNHDTQMVKHESKNPHKRCCTQSKEVLKTIVTRPIIIVPVAVTVLTGIANLFTQHSNKNQ